MKALRLLNVLVLVAPAACGAASTSDPGGDPAQTDAADASVPGPPDAQAVDSGASAKDSASSGTPDGATAPAGDQDLDGIDDATETTYADAYLPYLSIDPNDGCKTHGLLYRVSPHPTEPKRVMMWVDVLYNDDCGAAGHVGDDEMFGVVIDPSRPAPAGILAIRGISHQGTLCEHTTTCGACSGMTACSTATRDGKAYPAVFPSKDKHGNYADKGTCATSLVCDFGGCSLNPTPDAAAKVNAGEPGHPLVHDLTAQGFVNASNGWTHAELMHFDPWKPGAFGGAGDVSKDLVDTSFVVNTTKCP
jgi:hypothetical protein